MITAKIRCTSKLQQGEGENANARVSFAPDYTDGRNQEWALATPHLNLDMTLNGNVAEQFSAGQNFTLQFVPEEN